MRRSERRAPATGPSWGDRLILWLPVTILGVVLARLATQAAVPIADPDAWWHLRLGDDLVTQGSLATPAHWSSFGTVSWVPTEPLPEVVSALVERALGLPGLAWLFGLAVVLVVASVYVAARGEGGPLAATLATVLAALACSASLTSRPQLVSFMLLPVVVAAWLRTEQDLRPRWWLVPLTWGWSLCHGFWFIGAAYGVLALVGIVLSRRADRGQTARLALLAGLCFAVVTLNPVGLGVIEAPFAVQSLAPFVLEWRRTDLLSPAALVAEVMILATVLLWARLRTGVTWTRVLLLVSAAFWVWYAVRTVALGGLVTAPLLAGALETWISRASTRRLRLPVRREAGALVAWSVLWLVVLGLLVPHTSAEPGGVPRALDPALDRLAPGTAVFNDYELGGWLTWRHPTLNQYVDGLATPYSAAHVSDYVDAALYGVPDSYRIVHESGAGAALLEDTSPLVAVLRSHGWASRGSDAGYVLLEPAGEG